jgi:hypothetical protein
MQWFLERIGANSLPISFGVKDKQEHPEDFAKLIKKGVLKRGTNLDSVPCDLCDEGHECQVRENSGKLSYVCENGCGKKVLSDEDLAVYEYDNDAFLKLVAEDFSIKTDSSFSEVSEYTKNALYRVGTYSDKTLNAEVYYLRTNDAHEPSSVFEHLGNGTKVLITNTAMPDMVWGKNGTRYCVLAEVLATPSSKHIFDAAKFKKCLEGVRRVRFDTKQGQLFLDEKLVYTAGLKSPEHQFLACLWTRWQEQIPHADIHQFVREAMGKDVADTAQKFCNKMKSSIKKSYAGIDAIITIPTTGHYMMADPI